MIWIISILFIFILNVFFFFLLNGRNTATIYVGKCTVIICRQFYLLLQYYSSINIKHYWISVSLSCHCFKQLSFAFNKNRKLQNKNSFIRNQWNNWNNIEKKILKHSNYLPFDMYVYCIYLNWTCFRFYIDKKKSNQLIFNKNINCIEQYSWKNVYATNK